MRKRKEISPDESKEKKLKLTDSNLPILFWEWMNKLLEKGHERSQIIETFSKLSKALLQVEYWAITKNQPTTLSFAASSLQADVCQYFEALTNKFDDYKFSSKQAFLEYINEFYQNQKDWIPAANDLNSKNITHIGIFGYKIATEAHSVRGTSGRSLSIIHGLCFVNSHIDTAYLHIDSFNSLNNGLDSFINSLSKGLKDLKKNIAAKVEYPWVIIPNFSILTHFFLFDRALSLEADCNKKAKCIFVSEILLGEAITEKLVDVTVGANENLKKLNGRVNQVFKEGIQQHYEKLSNLLNGFIGDVINEAVRVMEAQTQALFQSSARTKKPVLDVPREVIAFPPDLKPDIKMVTSSSPIVALPKVPIGMVFEKKPLPVSAPVVASSVQALDGETADIDGLEALNIAIAMSEPKNGLH